MTQRAPVPNTTQHATSPASSTARIAVDEGKFWPKTRIRIEFPDLSLDRAHTAVGYECDFMFYEYKNLAARREILMTQTCLVEDP